MTFNWINKFQYETSPHTEIIQFQNFKNNQIRRFYLFGNLLEVQERWTVCFFILVFSVDLSKVPCRPARISRLSPTSEHVWCHRMWGHLYMKGLPTLKSAFKRRKHGYRAKYDAHAHKHNEYFWPITKREDKKSRWFTLCQSL